MLVVDDDRRVLELLEVALVSHGFRVLTAPDGEEALRCARHERPDLVVLDLRLPKKSGFDVCEGLRRDPDDPDVPILVVSAMPEPDTRLEAFRRGADDYLGKPFSPRELVARARRLLARATDTRTARARARELERNLGVTRDEATRAIGEARRATRLRELAERMARDLPREVDLDVVAETLLRVATRHTGAGFAALLLPVEDGGRLAPWSVRGDGFERAWGLDVPARGALTSVLASLGRPAWRHELERFPELRESVAPFVAAGIAVIAPLGGGTGLEGLLVLDERRDGRGYDREQLAALATLAEVGAGALAAALRVRTLSNRLLALLAPRADGPTAEAMALVQRAVRALGLSEGGVPVVRQAIAFASEPASRRRLADEAPHDAGGQLARVMALLDEAGAPCSVAARLVAAGIRFAAARAAGQTPTAALDHAVSALAREDRVAEALREAVREMGTIRPAA